MSPNKYIKRIFQAKAAKKDSDFSTFVPATPPTRRQQLIEECKKLGVSTCIDDPLERSTIFQGDASEVELERRLNAKKAIGLSERANTLSKCENVISLLAFIVATILSSNRSMRWFK